MRPLVSANEMAAIDRAAQSRYGIPGAALMENAGQRVFDRLVETLHLNARIVFLVGPGNNGGDACVMARRAACDGAYRPTVVAVDDRVLQSDGVASCASYGVRVLSFESDRGAAETAIDDADCIVDGIAGTGIKGALRPAAAEMVGFVNAVPRRVVSIDVPSGAYDDFSTSDPIVDASETFTMGLPKTSLYHLAVRPHAGTISVVSPGFPPDLLASAKHDAVLLDERDKSTVLDLVSPDAHKGRRGHVAVYAGAVGTSGAAVLAARGAVHAGAGLVTLTIDDAEYAAAAARCLSVMVRPSTGYLEPPRRASAFVLGPGWGTGEGRAETFEALIADGRPGVLDADALVLLAGYAEKTGTVDLNGGWVLTPHPAELARLLGRTIENVLADPFGAAKDAATRFHSICVLKSFVTYIASPDETTAVWDGMTRELGTGGSGDVLAGVVGALLARGLDARAAARAAVVIHGEAGRLAAQQIGWFSAEQLFGYIARIANDRDIRA